MVPRKPHYVTVPEFNNIPAGLATLVRATEDVRQSARNNLHLPPITTVRMMNNLAEPSVAKATIPIKPPIRIEPLCHRCGYDGTDIVVKTCGCAFHARCIPWHLDTMGGVGAGSNSTVNEASASGDKAAARKLINSCPACKHTPCSLALQPMKFDELDEARKQSLLIQGNKKKKIASSDTTGKKRKMEVHETQDEDQDTSISGDNTNKLPASRTHTKNNGMAHNSTSAHSDGDCRVGRWSEEETKFCNKLIAHFMAGQFPLLEGAKLNEFLANVLKLKQSRLTKKMKNAALAAKHFSRTTGYIPTVQECIDFSATEQDFLKKLINAAEAADLKFHMQLFWRESFTTFCAKIQQPLDAREWLASVEEMERRASFMKDAARMAKRKVYMGYAFDMDKLNPELGIFIDSDQTTRQNHASSILENSIHSSDDELDEFVNLIATDQPSANMPTNDSEFFSKAASTNRILGKNNAQTIFHDNCNSWHYSSPFLAKVLVIIHRRCLPFEYLEAWVPSESSGDITAGCRLYFAGNAITDSCVPPSSIGSTSSSESTTVPLTPDERFNLLCFGDYSEKFSFHIGSGLPGRVYETGVPIWEQNISESDKTHYERCGAAKLFGIRTALGIPVPSPTVGRIILVLYSQHDRPRDNNVVFNLVEEVVKLLPSPRWKLYIDVGKDRSTAQTRAERAKKYMEKSMDSHAGTGAYPSKTANSRASMETFKSEAEPSLPSSDSLSRSNNPGNVNAHHNLKVDSSDTLSRSTNFANLNTQHNLKVGLSDPVSRSNNPPNLNSQHNLKVDSSDPLSRSNNNPINSNAHNKLKVDSNRPQANESNLKEELISILGENMPLDASSEFAFCLPGFMSLRLLLLKSNKTAEEEDMIATILNSFASFRSTRLTNGEIAVMLTRDFLYLRQLQSRLEQQTSVMPIFQQWSNNHIQLPVSSLSNLHPPLDGTNSSFSVPPMQNFQFLNGMAMPNEQHQLLQTLDSLNSDSDQHSFSTNDRFSSYR